MIVTATLIALAKIGDRADGSPGIAGVIRPWLANGNQEIHEAATIALGYLRDVKTAELLAKEAGDVKKPFLARLFSVLAVGYLGDRKAAPPGSPSTWSASAVVAVG